MRELPLRFALIASFGLLFFSLVAIIPPKTATKLCYVNDKNVILFSYFRLLLLWSKLTKLKNIYMMNIDYVLFFRYMIVQIVLYAFCGYELKRSRNIVAVLFTWGNGSRFNRDLCAALPLFVLVYLNFYYILHKEKCTVNISIKNGSHAWL